MKLITNLVQVPHITTFYVEYRIGFKFNEKDPNSSIFHEIWNKINKTLKFPAYPNNFISASTFLFYEHLKLMLNYENEKIQEKFQ